MSKTGILILLLLAPLAGLAQNREFKSFYKDGKDKMASGDFAGAAKDFEEALRIEPKAQKYKTEGNFFDNYLPRYQIALAYEKIDVLQAANWVDKSKEAVESDVIRKRKNDLAAYHADISRISKAAESFLAERRRNYDRKLAEAKGLLNANRFTEAKTALEKLVAMDPGRSEGKIALNSISTQRNNYLKGVSLEVERATFKKDWKQAERLLAKMKAVDAGYPEIATLTAGLTDAREAEKQAALAKEQAAKVVKKPDTPKPKETTVVKNTTPRPDPAAAARKREARRKAEVREGLLASLSQYRKGYADKALNELRKIPEEKGNDYSSYHWLKGVYLLTSYRQSEKGDETLRQEAGEAMARVAKLQPNFQPDGRLYPAFILDFYKETQK